MTLSVAQLPEALQPEIEKVILALGTPLLAEWPEDTKVIEAPQPAAIGKALVPALHTHLVGAEIAYLFREQMVVGTHLRLAKASKANPALHLLAEVDFVITVNWSAWRALTGPQRIALIDHELCHCEYDAEHGKWVLARHDVEEFTAIIKRWGLWKPDLVPFAQAIRQLDLFTAARAEG